MIRLKKVLFISGITLGLCLIMMITISLIFGDRITAFVIKKINENLNTEISVKSAEFSIFRRFPNAAVVFNDVVIKANKNFDNNAIGHENANLIKSKTIYAEINIIKILFKDYTIKRITAEEGELNLVINEKGVQNFDIFKKDDSPGKKSSTVNLASILLKKFHFNYIDLKHSIKFIGLIDQLQLKGLIKGDHSNFEINTELLSQNLIVRDIEYLKGKRVNTELSINIQGELYTIETSELNLEGIDIYSKMMFSAGDKSEIDLVAKATDVNLAGFQRLMPETYKKYIESFESKGKTSFMLSVRGKSYGNFLPHIQLDFDLKNGLVRQTRNNIKLTSINCSGSYTNGKGNNSESSSFTINRFSSSLGQGNISGNLTYQNFTTPNIIVGLKTLIDLGSIRKFLAIDTIERLEGKLRAEINLAAGFNNANSFKRENIRSFKISGNANVNDAQLKLKSSNYLYNEINSEIILGNDFQFDNLSLKIDNNDFFIKGRLYDAVPYLLKQNNTLNLRAELRSQNLDLSKYFEKNPNQVSSDKYDADVLFPADLLAELNVSVSNFTLNKFHAKNTIARVNYKPGMYTLNSAVFETMQGKVSGNGAVLQDMNHNLIVKGQTSLKKLDIKQLFYVFGNFGQSILQDRHLKGSLSGEILVSCQWDSKMNLNKDAILVESNLEIANGELINFEPLLGLSRFISLSELKDIKFSTLKNQVFIRHQQIILPKMDINSSALNISGSGVHDFDNHYTYHINVFLSEVLARKAKSNKKENDEFGIIEDDGLGKTRIPLMIVGFNNDYKISYDTKGVKEILKESMLGQKQELKNIFKEEFGLYKNDSTVVKPKSTTKFKVEWDEQKTVTEEKDPKPIKSKKKKTFEEEEGYQIEFEK